MKTLTNFQFNFPAQKNVYHGKVRDVYNIADQLLVMIASDRISAFDVVLPYGIPYKGQVLNQTAAYFLKNTADIVPNWLIDTPDPVVAIGTKCEPLKVEMVIRGYLAGHAAREYAQGKRTLCGATLAEGLKENDKLPQAIITPSTKAEHGHDEDISASEIIKQGLVSEQDWQQIEAYTHALFQRGSQMANEKGLILVDTKYEFGKTADGKILLIDEIHTPDSSRYFYKEGYQERQEKGEAQKQLSKEFVRQWLIQNGFQGRPGEKIPEMTEEFISTVSKRYIELYEHISGLSFVAADNENIVARIESNVNKALASLNN